MQIRPVLRGDGPRLNETVAIADLPVVFDRVDAEVRAALPPAFLTRFDEWVAAGGKTTARYSSPRTPGPTVTSIDLDTAIETVWGKDAAGRADPATSLDHLQRTIRLYDVIDVVIVLSEPHRVLSGAVVLGEEVEVSDFGKWFTADHSDAKGLSDLLQRLDAWVRLRLGFPARARTPR